MYDRDSTIEVSFIRHGEQEVRLGWAQESALCHRWRNTIKYATFNMYTAFELGISNWEYHNALEEQELKLIM